MQYIHGISVLIAPDAKIVTIQITKHKTLKVETALDPANQLNCFETLSDHGFSTMAMKEGYLLSLKLSKCNQFGTGGTQFRTAFKRLTKICIMFQIYGEDYDEFRRYCDNNFGK